MPDRRESASDKRRMARELAEWSLENPAEGESEREDIEPGTIEDTGTIEAAEEGATGADSHRPGVRDRDSRPQ